MESVLIIYYVKFL